jgi:hypothetical protein
MNIARTNRIQAVTICNDRTFNFAANKRRKNIVD